MFQNLYWSSAEFRNHNFNDFFDDLLAVPREEIDAEFASFFHVNGSTSLDPTIFWTIRFTLSEKACQSFLRKSPLPVDERDYYLGKLYQFLYKPMAARYEWIHPAEAGDDLLVWLDSLPAHALPPVHFNWEGLYNDLTPFDLDQIIENLPTYLQSGAVQNTETPSQLIDRLRGQKSIEQIAGEADLDVKQVYKIRRCEDVLVSTIKKLARSLGCKPGDLIAP